MQKRYTKVKGFDPYKEHPRRQHRWSVYAGSITWTVYHCGPVKCGLYKQVVFIYKWFLDKVRLYNKTYFVDLVFGITIISNTPQTRREFY